MVGVKGPRSFDDIATLPDRAIAHGWQRCSGTRLGHVLRGGRGVRERLDGARIDAARLEFWVATAS